MKKIISVRFKHFLILFLGILGFCLQASAQVTMPPPQGQQRPQQRQAQDPDEDQEEAGPRRGILDDSTKQVYGPRTTLYFKEKHIRHNRFELTEIDTALTGFHNYEPVARHWYRHQDLGNIGSGAMPIFYEIPGQIGRTSGFHAYDLYYNSPDSMTYFDTKSPYTNLGAFFGGGNRNMLDVAFARNINPRWNVGFNFNTIRARKVLNPSRRDDNMAVQNSYSIHTSYRSENEKYILLANFSRMKHTVNEQGGIIPPEVDSTSLYFTYEDSKMWLRNSQANDLRQDYHLYHQYEVVKGWQIYHVFDKKKQEVSFVSDMAGSDNLFFDQFNTNRFHVGEDGDRTDSTRNLSHFSEWRNEFGFKGDIGPIYYNAFMKFRTGRMASPYFESNNSFNEFYIGGALRGQISERWYFEGEGEYFIPDAFRIKGLFRSPYLDLTYTKALYRPTLMHLLYRGNHFQWTNDDLSNTGVDQITGQLKADFGPISIRPSLTLNRVSNYIYYNQEVVPEQTAADAFMVIPGVTANLFLGKFAFQSEIYNTTITGDGADNFRIPEWFVNSRIFYDSPWFDENIFVQIGIEGRYRSEYFAPAWMPSTQQFYLQDNFLVQGYPVVDFFFNFRINRTRISIRYNHLNDNLLEQPGYFVTPGYTGLKGMLDLGINWSFFD
ncbi:putative porin [Litoribacter ruber]|nr:putative porin [Litoribacter alkaliphilus]